MSKKVKADKLPQTIYVAHKEFDDKSGEWLSAEADPKNLADQVGADVEAGEYRLVRTVRIVNATEIKPAK